MCELKKLCKERINVTIAIYGSERIVTVDFWAYTVTLENNWFTLTVRGRVRPDSTTGSMWGRLTGERLVLKKKYDKTNQHWM